MNEREYERMFRVEDSHWWYVSLHELILDRVTEEVRSGRTLRLLDAGCGTGRLCSLLEKFGQVEGCDLSQQAIAYSRERGLTAVFCADLNGADLGEERYDVITSIDVLYHRAVADDAAILAKFYRALKPGGLLILNLVAHEFLRSTHDIAVHTRKRYTRKELLPILAEEGFAVERATYRPGFLFIPIACYRLTKRLLPYQREAALVESDVRLPSPLFNRLLLFLARAENHFLRRHSSPFGSSLFITARRPL
jgi:SAM-dependent methyltransferase